MGRKDTLEEFIAKAKSVHGNKYIYDKVEYINNRTEIIITCPIHGDFDMLPNNHINLKQGCYKCAIESKKKTTKEFITEAKMVHGNRYDYSKTEYVNNYTPVNIICPVHGKFQQVPSSHLNGCGCYECAKLQRAKTKTKSTKDFVKESIAIHGNKYNYSKVDYINATTIVTITCPIHGDFPQLPYKHKQYHGCPYCQSSHLETETRILLDKNNIIFEPQKKFPWLKSNKNYPMFLDFYLPEYNIAIECQGEQHYLEEPRWVFTEETLTEIKQRDTLKYNLCKEHRIPIYYIRYDENVKEKINEILNELSRQKIICC